MEQAAKYVAANPGCVTYDAVLYVAPCGVPGGKPGIQYGYRTIDRAVSAGLIRREPGKGNSYRLYPATP